jgi:hypothetical protein
VKPLYIVAGVAVTGLVAYGAYRFMTGGRMNPGYQVTPNPYTPRPGPTYTPPPVPVDNTAADINATANLVTAGANAFGTLAGAFGGMGDDSGNAGDDVQADWSF